MVIIIYSKKVHPTALMALEKAYVHIGQPRQCDNQHRIHAANRHVVSLIP